MNQTDECINCRKRYGMLTKNHKCFFCDREGWYKTFKQKKEEKVIFRK